MTTEHEHLERLAVRHDEQADDLFADIANGEILTKEEKAEMDAEAQAHRRAAEIIRYQIECEG